MKVLQGRLTHLLMEESILALDSPITCWVTSGKSIFPFVEKHSFWPPLPLKKEKIRLVMGKFWPFLKLNHQVGNLLVRPKSVNLRIPLTKYCFISCDDDSETF